MKSTSSKVARRYARALALLCDERGDAAAVALALGNLARVLRGEPEALAFLADPTVPAETRRTAVVRALDGLGIGGTARAFVMVLTDKHRVSDLPAIESAFASLLDARTGRVHAHVTAATALGDAAVERLKGVLERLLGKEVQLSASSDVDLIGGLVVRVGNTVYDASVRNHLNRLRHQLVHD